MNQQDESTKHAVDDTALTRRELLAGAAGAIGGAVLSGLPSLALGEQPVRATAASQTAPSSVATTDPTKGLGTPTSAVGARSPFVKAGRTPVGEVTGVSYAPLQDLTGTITPADLHFERHHAGVPALDPATHTLVVHGLVDRPLEFTLEDLRRFPQVTRTHFVECSGNGRSSFRDPKPDTTPQKVAGMVSNSEWTGVPLRFLLDEAGAKPGARWILAEGQGQPLGAHRRSGFFQP